MVKRYRLLQDMINNFELVNTTKEVVRLRVKINKRLIDVYRDGTIDKIIGYKKKPIARRQNLDTVNIPGYKAVSVGLLVYLAFNFEELVALTELHKIEEAKVVYYNGKSSDARLENMSFVFSLKDSLDDN